MKILLVNSYSNGSTGNIAKDIMCEMNRAGNNTCYFAYGAGENLSNAFSFNSAIGMKKHAYLTLFTGLHGYFSHFETKKLIDYIKTINPDIIHFHNLHGGYLDLPLLFDFLSVYHSKYIFTLHDCWLYTGKCYHYYEAKCDKWKTGCYDCPQLSMYPKSIFFDRTRKMYNDKKEWLNSVNGRTYITTVSEWLYKETQKSFLKDFPIYRINNGIDINLFSPKSLSSKIDQKYGIKGKKVILGVASSWNKHKGLNDFIELNKLLKRDECIILVGVNDKQKNELPSNIICINRTDKVDELVSLYSRANIFLNCSTEETFGLVTAEAMSCGTPAIVYSATGCYEVVDNMTGAIVKPHDINELRKSIDRLLLNNEEIGVLCRSRIIEHYSREKMIKSYIKLYEDVILNEI